MISPKSISISKVQTRVYLKAPSGPPSITLPSFIVTFPFRFAFETHPFTRSKCYHLQVFSRHYYPAILQLYIYYWSLVTRGTNHSRQTPIPGKKYTYSYVMRCLFPGHVACSTWHGITDVVNTYSWHLLPIAGYLFPQSSSFCQHKLHQIPKVLSPGYQSQLCYLLAVWPWPSYLNSLDFRILIQKGEEMKLLSSRGVEED